MMDLSQSTRVLCFGRIINVDIKYYDSENKKDKAVSIMTPKTGLKPDISVSMQVIPSNNVTNMTVIIRNMIIDFDISKAYYMTVQMGYETCGVAVYESIIFRSYQATPNPDGEFVFEGVVVGDTTGYQNDIGIVEQDPFTLMLNDCGEMSVYEFVHYILNGECGWKKYKKLSGSKGKPKYKFSIDVDDISLENKLKLYTLPISKDIKGFTTPLSRATYAKQVLTNYAETNGIPLVVVIDGNKFLIKSTAQDTTVAPDSAIDIIGYTAASYNGAILNITMPYFPAINAGSLIRCDASFVTQGGPPNKNGNDVLKKNYSWSMYRVMKFSVNFSTVHDNTMSIDAFPIRERGKVSVVKEDKKNKKRSVQGSYFKEAINMEYKNRNNYGEVIIGDNNIDINVVKAKKNQAGRRFNGTYVEYNPIGNFDIISFISKLYDDYMIKCTSIHGEIGLVASMYNIFPIVFSATWYASKIDNKIAVSESYFPISFSSGYIVIPPPDVINENSNLIASILMDFIHIYEPHNKNNEYSDLLKVWHRMIDINNGGGTIEIVPRDPGA